MTHLANAPGLLMVLAAWVDALMGYLMYMANSCLPGHFLEEALVCLCVYVCVCVCLCVCVCVQRVRFHIFMYSCD